MPVLQIAISPTEQAALRKLSDSEYRDPRAQARLIIRRALRRRGLLPKRNPTAQPSKAQPNNSPA
jgi:hypothetical protein